MGTATAVVYSQQQQPPLPLTWLKSGSMLTARRPLVSMLR